MFREAVRVPRHAFSPNSTGAMGTPLDFLTRAALLPGSFDFLEQDGRESWVQQPYYRRHVLFATFLETNASQIVSNCYRSVFGALGKACQRGCGVERPPRELWKNDTGNAFPGQQGAKGSPFCEQSPIPDLTGAAKMGSIRWGVRTPRDGICNPRPPSATKAWLKG